jgi:hypothetical protein
MITVDPHWWRGVNKSSIAALIGFRYDDMIHVILSQQVESVKELDILLHSIEDSLPGGLSVIGVAGPVGFVNGVKCPVSINFIIEWNLVLDKTRVRLNTSGFFKPVNSPPREVVMPFMNIVIKLPIHFHFREKQFVNACTEWFQSAVHLTNLERLERSNIGIQHALVRIGDFEPVLKSDKRISQTITLVGIVTDTNLNNSSAVLREYVHE